VNGHRHERALLDTSVVVDLVVVAPQVLPVQLAVSTLTLAELTAGPHATDDPDVRARRQSVLQRTETMFDPLPFDIVAAQHYGQIYAEVRARGRKARGRRAVDLLIAAVAMSNQLPLYTRNPDDFDGLEGLIEIVSV
jgi:predicted nucleic acid-binding protein